MSDVAVWGDFEVHFSKILGRGGMGSVYRARQRSLDRWVALKVLDTTRAPDPELAQGFLEKFHIEALALARLQDPRIVTILQAGENDGRCWFAMELIEGRTLEQALTEDGALAPREAARVACEVARALDAAFRQGITHRDVKPANIFLCPDGSVKLADFGLARSAEFSRTKMTDANAVACTPSYASPEMAEGAPSDHRADIYSLGCVLYEMVTERAPFDGQSNMEILFKHTTEPPPSPRVLNPDVPPELEHVILRCLEKAPGARYPDYPELIRDLDLAPAVAPPRGWFWPAAAIAGAALIGILLATIYSYEEPPKIVFGNPRDVVEVIPEPPPAPPLPTPKEPEKPAVAPPPPAPVVEKPVEPKAEPLPPSPDELRLIRALWALIEEKRDDVARRDYDAAIPAFDAMVSRPDHTPLTRAATEAARDSLRRARELEARFEQSLAPGREVALLLQGTKPLNGTLRRASGEALVLVPTGATEPVEVPRKSLMAETVTVGVGDPDRLLYRAVHGEIAEAARELVKAAEAARLPAAVQTLAVRAARELDHDRRAPGEELIAILSETSIPEASRYVLEPLKRLAHELDGHRALMDGKLTAVVEDFAGTRAFPRALGKLREEAVRRFARERLAGSEIEQWSFEPFEQDLVVRRRHIYVDPAEKAFVLSDPAGRRAMARPVAEFARGFLIVLAFAPAPGTGERAWALLLTDPAKAPFLELVGTPERLEILERPGNGSPGKRVAAVESAAGGFRRLIVLPAGKFILVWEGEAKVFRIALPPGAQLTAEAKLGVTGGALKVKSLKVASAEEE